MNSLAKVTHLPELSRERRLNLFDNWMNDFFSEFAPFDDFMPSIFINDGKGTYPKVNIIDHEDRVSIQAALPGMTKEDIDVEVKDGMLTISGKSQSETTSEDRYVRREIKKTAFRRSWSLGNNLDTKNILASFDNGMLNLEINKLQKEEQVSTKVEIK